MISIASSGRSTSPAPSGSFTPARRDVVPATWSPSSPSSPTVPTADRRPTQTAARRTSSERGVPGGPVWSPDGTKLRQPGRRSGTRSLAVTELTGGTTFQLVRPSRSLTSRSRRTRGRRPGTASPGSTPRACRRPRRWTGANSAAARDVDRLAARRRQGHLVAQWRRAGVEEGGLRSIRQDGSSRGAQRGSTRSCSGGFRALCPRQRRAPRRCPARAGIDPAAALAGTTGNWSPPARSPVW